jgi:hypothetical protein
MECVTPKSIIEVDQEEPLAPLLEAAKPPQEQGMIISCRNRWYITSIVLKIISCIVGFVCVTIVACMIDDYSDEKLNPASDITGAITILLDFLVVPFMARAAAEYVQNPNLSDKRCYWLKVLSWILYFIMVIYGLVLLFADINVSAGMVAAYVVGASLSWTFMLVYVEHQYARTHYSSKMQTF